MTAIKPLGNRILIKRSEAEKTKGGILLPDSAQEKPKMGIVVEVGPGKINQQGKTEQMHIHQGDTVLFTSFAGTEVHLSDEEEKLLILSEDDILGILEK